MARGAASKEVVMNKILSTFDGSFKYDKEIRVPMVENGEVIQIKITLTAAKTNVEPGGDTAMPGVSTAKMSVSTPSASNIGSVSSNFTNEPTAEEKKNIKELIEKLGIE